MAHAVETMAFAGELPWHGLGKPVAFDLTTDEMLKESGTDWTVSKRPLYYKNQKGELVASDRVSLVRDTDDFELTTISGRWEPVQNKTAFDFFHEFVKAGNMQMHTAGSLFDGRRVWVLARVKEDFTLFGGDTVESYLLFSNPHEYGKAIDIRFTPIRVVCANTLSLSLREKSDMSVSLSHRTKFDPEMVKQTLGLATKRLGDYKEMAEFLGSRRYDGKDVINYFRTLFPRTGIAAGANDNDNAELSQPAKVALMAMMEQPGANYAEGTWWQVFNSVTYYADHLAGRQRETRLASAWYGPMRERKIKALELAVEYAEQSKAA